ncbi:MAG: hypothetical protein M3322_12250 [Actinomycetota bacterium]|nr:hypothetical protein [Actinomycetota bacterium]
MPRVLMLAVLALALLASGCDGSSDESPAEESASTTRPTPPPARTIGEWRQRLLERFLVGMDRSLEKVNALTNPQARFYVYSGNPETLRVLETAFGRLIACSERLRRVGDPPAGRRSLRRAYRSLQRACPQYERLGRILREGVPLLSSEDAGERARAGRVLRQAGQPSRLAATHYRRALTILADAGIVKGYDVG